MRREISPLPDNLDSLTEAEFGIGSCASYLLQISFEDQEYKRNTSLKLLAAGRGREGESWAERRLAVLLLENQILRLAADDLGEFDLLFVELGLKAEAGLEVPLHESVLEVGFSRLDLRGFIGELRRKLHRLDRVHHQGDWGYFFRAARDVSKLMLGRFVFTAEECFREILRELIVTTGTEDTLSRCRGQTGWALDLFDAPGYEREILSLLCKDHPIYWVSPGCGSELNALVEYPLTSAVIVIKPPGSDFEIEIKRAGTRGERLLDVILTRNGKDAPISHRLFGGSLGWLAQRETTAARIFSKIYRLVHGIEGPCSKGVMNSSIVTIPAPAGETHILDYLTDENQFGSGFEQTRAAMNACVEAFPKDTGVARASYSGEAGLTLQFAGQALPQQAILFGSSSFRLDRVLLYLSELGPEDYFRKGLGRDYMLHDLRWLADSVLEEILGEITVPPEKSEDYSQYLRDAFQIPANRTRADQNYLSVLRQIGECWGTLLAVRGFSDGESFVLRNVGLKSVWQSGEWRIRIIFMDNDDLTVAGSRYPHLWPWREVSGMERDQIHILGGPMSGEIIPGEVGTLKSIYRVSPEVGEEGVRSLEKALCAAYRKTQSRLDSDAQLQGVFYPTFIERHRDFDQLVPWFLDKDPIEAESWKAEAVAYLRTKNCDEELATEYAKTVCHFRSFFERISFLYGR
jgi:hypothetical protein